MADTNTGQPEALNASEIIAEMIEDPTIDFFYTKHPDEITDEQFRRLIRRERIARETDVKK